MINNNISIIEKEECCGCLACENICPKQCILLKDDSEGFIHPEVMEDDCIHCNACPALKILDDNKNKANKVIACHANESSERNAGSSGGIFGLLAKQILQEKGVVWGVAFDKNLQVKHVKVTQYSDLTKLFKSKYVQSNTQGIYGIIKDDLNKGIPVLFSGTPCQCDALRRFLRKDYSNLIIVGIICHGVPNQKLFNDYIKWHEETKHVKVKNFTFRYKSVDFQYERGYCIESEGGKLSKKQYYYSPYYYAFSNLLILRPACYQCKWAKIERVEDITLGDFWELEKYISTKGIGYSAVLLNTLKGEEFFAKVIHQTVYKELPIENIIDNNECLHAPSTFNKNRNKFFEDYRMNGFDYVRRKYMTPSLKYRVKKDIYFSLPILLRKQLKLWLMK